MNRIKNELDSILRNFGYWSKDSIYISIMSIVENKNIKKNEILKELDKTLRNFGHWSKDSIYISIMSFMEKELIKMEY